MEAVGFHIGFYAFNNQYIFVYLATTQNGKSITVRTRETVCSRFKRLFVTQAFSWTSGFHNDAETEPPATESLMFWRILRLNYKGNWCLVKHKTNETSLSLNLESRAHEYALVFSRFIWKVSVCLDLPERQCHTSAGRPLRNKRLVYGSMLQSIGC